MKLYAVIHHENDELPFIEDAKGFLNENEAREFALSKLKEIRKRDWPAFMLDVHELKIFVDPEIPLVQFFVEEINL